MSNTIKYPSFEEVLTVYQKTINASGGGLVGIRDSGGIKSILDFVQNNNYYPDFVSKLTYLVFRFCSGHFFDDGNKRIALTIGVYFLHQNGQHWSAVTFMQRMEAIVYHIAASNIDDQLLHRIMVCIVECKDFDESLKMDIVNAMDNGNIYNDLEIGGGDE